MIPLTLKAFESIPAQEIFAAGKTVDSPEGLHMMGTGKPIYWVAVKGTNNDWSLYCGWQSDMEDLKDNGDKVHDEQNVRNVILVADEIWELYRH